MSEAEKEMYIESLKRHVRSHYNHDEADKLCRRLDIAKKKADTLEQLYNSQLHSLEELIKLF